MTDAAGLLTSREALLFEETAGCAVMAAVAQLRAGELTVAAAAAAILVIGRRRVAERRAEGTATDDVTLEDVFDTYEMFGELIAAGTTALGQLLDDEEG